MRFEYIYLLHLLWLTPLVILFFVYSYNRRKLLLEKFCDITLCSKIIDGFSLNRRKIKYGLLTIVLILFIITLARPQVGFIWEDIQRKGVDIYVALDVSDSMLAEDMKPSRLERAKRKLIDLMNILQGDRVGVVIFAGSAFVQCPLTLDYNAIQMFIDNINTQSITTKGTSIANAIQTCLDGFKRSAESGSKAIILITDGEDHEGKLIELAKEAKKQNVIIYAIGIGSETGSYIPGENGLKKDSSGKAILTKANFNQLKEIAEITGGTYTNSVTSNLDIDSIYIKGIKKVLKEKDLKSTRAKNWIDRFQWPLCLALILILIELFFSEKKFKAIKYQFNFFKKVFYKSNLLLLLFLLSLANISIPTYAESVNSQLEKAQNSYQNGKYKDALSNYINAQVEKPDEFKIKYNIGNTYYKLNDYNKASESYDFSLKNKHNNLQKSKIFYNIANSSYKKGDKNRALEYYLKAILLNPDDVQARQNYEFILNQKKNPPPKCKNPKNKDKNNNKSANNSKDKQKETNNQQKNNKDKQNKNNPQKKQDKLNKQHDKINKNQADMILSNLEEAKRNSKTQPTKLQYGSNKDW